jgi:hypothetical protein
VSHTWTKCPTCGADASHLEVYDIGSGPELSCPNCEWCWGAEGQPLQALKHFDPAILRARLMEDIDDPDRQVTAESVNAATMARLTSHPEGESDS